MPYCGMAFAINMPRFSFAVNVLRFRRLREYVWYRNNTNFLLSAVFIVLSFFPLLWKKLKEEESQRDTVIHSIYFIFFIMEVMRNKGTENCLLNNIDSDKKKKGFETDEARLFLSVYYPELIT